MKIGGVDPAVLRELSGIYKPFVKAVKELISNAYDADSETVHIEISQDFNTIVISDDGVGMTPADIRSDFTRIGGSYARHERGEITKKGRQRIGSKGIGFVAPARYCCKMQVVSSTVGRQKETFSIPVCERTDLRPLLNIRVSPDIFRSRVRITKVTPAEDSNPIEENRYHVCERGLLLISDAEEFSEHTHLTVECEVDWGHFETIATIDFDYLLGLENRRDLEQITDFCDMHVELLPENDHRIEESYTRISLLQLKEFVRQDLKTNKRPGFVRNVVSKDGLSRFVWELSRCVPVQYEQVPGIDEHFGGSVLHPTNFQFISEITFTGGHFNRHELRRPVWNMCGRTKLALNDDLCYIVDINEAGLVASGFVIGLPETIYPAEYRGISIRVRNVQIGAPSFQGLEDVLSGSAKGFLSQITGEINIVKGLDAIDAINPGRESFYGENPQYKALRRILVGEGESAGGLVGKIVQALQNRSRVATAVRDVFRKAEERRRILENLSSGILHFATSTEHSDGLNGFFSTVSQSSNGLSQVKDIDLNPTHRIGGFSVEQGDAQGGYNIDFDGRKVYLDTSRITWSWRIRVLSDYYDVSNKDGGAGYPICEVDTINKRIYVNWSHPIRSQMDEKSFLKSAIAWKIALHASMGNGDRMLNLGLGLLSYKD